MEATSPARSALAALLLAALAVFPAPALPQAESSLDRIEGIIEAGRPDEALRMLAQVEPTDESTEARVLLLQSTAHFMLGQLEIGRSELEAALAKDPTLRQAWLNRAALDISDGELDRAIEALQRARALDPEAPDTDLNLGAVLLMQGKIGDAQPYFKRYLTAAGDSAEAWYLVASNYAIAGQSEAAVQHLARAFSIDERIRLRARTDANFTQLGEDSAFQALLNVDSYRIPAGSHAVYRSYEAPYLGGQGKLLPAVLDALQLTGEPFDRQIEVTPDWALIWGEMRIKVRDDGHEGGRVELTAPRSRFSDSAWRERVGPLFAEITVQLAKR